MGEQVGGGCSEFISVYRCPNKKVDGSAVYTNTLPAGAFRGYGLSQTVFAVESAMDELAVRNAHHRVADGTGARVVAN